MTAPSPPPSSPPPSPHSVPGLVRRPRADASDRILQAAVQCIVQSGSAAVTMHEVAEEAGVSKGLIHYHFHDKETLLARVVEWMAHGLEGRERQALAQSTPRRAIEDLWTWLAGELERGHVRVLLELGEWRAELVQRAVRDTARRRRASAAASVGHLFELLGLKPRIPSALMADVVVSFVNGITVSAALEPTFNPRAAFDVFWLAMLSLGE